MQRIHTQPTHHILHARWLYATHTDCCCHHHHHHPLGLFRLVRTPTTLQPQSHFCHLRGPCGGGASFGFATVPPLPPPGHERRNKTTTSSCKVTAASPVFLVTQGPGVRGATCRAFATWRFFFFFPARRPMHVPPLLRQDKRGQPHGGPSRIFPLQNVFFFFIACPCR